MSSPQLKTSVAATKQELVISVARLLGFDRLGSDLEGEITRQVDALVRVHANRRVADKILKGLKLLGDLE